MVEETGWDSDYDEMDFFSDDEFEVLTEEDSDGAPPPLEGDPPDAEVENLKKLLQIVKKL